MIQSGVEGLRHAENRRDQAEPHAVAASPSGCFGKPMPQHVARANAGKSAIRAAVEHVSAHQKNRFGLFIRTIGLARAEAKLTLANLAYNFDRLIFYERAGARGEFAQNPLKCLLCSRAPRYRRQGQNHQVLAGIQLAAVSHSHFLFIIHSTSAAREALVVSSRDACALRTMAWRMSRACRGSGAGWTGALGERADHDRHKH